jgi:hypothetical protein
MMWALLVGGVWQICASYMELNVSATHSIIGAIVGFSMTFKGALRGARLRRGGYACRGVRCDATDAMRACRRFFCSFSRLALLAALSDAPRCFCADARALRAQAPAPSSGRRSRRCAPAR